MAQASFQWHRVVNQLHGSPLTELDFNAFKQLPLEQLTKSSGWVVGLVGGAALLLWDGKLVLATGTGVGMMLAVYLAQEGRWKFPWADVHKFLRGANRQLVLSVGAGAAATLGTYMAVSIWADSGSPWMALSETLQGLGILAILGLLVRQSMSRRSHRDEVYFNQMLADLTHDDPLKRLIAVRQITHLVTEKRLEPTRDRTIADYFRLMLSREQETTIRDAVLEGLYALDTVHSLNPSQQEAFVPPIAVRRPPSKVRRKPAQTWVEP